MNRSPQRRPLICLSVPLLILLVIAAAGCGGSTPPGANGSPLGSYNNTGAMGNAARSSTTGSGAASAPLDAKAASTLPKTRLAVFVTATPPAQGAGAPAHLWATVLKVELLDKDGKATPIFDSPEGVTLDLLTLHDTSGLRFAPLTSAPLLPGTKFTNARVTFARAWTQFAPGASTGETVALGETIAKDAEGRPTLSFPLTRPRDLGTGTENLIVDVNLDKTAFKIDSITPSLRENGDGKPGDPTRQNALLLTGTISEAAANDKGSSTFLLVSADGRTAYVTVSEAAALFNDGPDANPALTDGRRVQVRGYLANDSKKLVASSIKIYGATDESTLLPAASLAGSVVRADANGGGLVLRAYEVSGILPTQDAVNVTLAKDAVLRTAGGLKLAPDDFWNAVSGRAARLRVEGNYEPVTGALVATRARFEDADAAPAASHEADITGVPGSADADTGSVAFAAPLMEWDGVAAPGGKDAKMPVAITAATVLRDDKDNPLPAADFWAAVKDNKAAMRVVGVYAKGTLTATRASLRPLPAKPEPKEAKADAKPATDAPSNGDKAAPVAVKAESTPETAPAIPAAPPTVTPVTPSSSDGSGEKAPFPQPPSKKGEL